MYTDNFPEKAERVVGLASTDLTYSRTVRVKLVKTGGRAGRTKRVDTYAPLILAQAGRETSGDVKPQPRNKWDVNDTYRRDGWLWRIAAVCYRCHRGTGWTRIEAVREVGFTGVLPAPKVRECRHGK